MDMHSRRKKKPARLIVAIVLSSMGLFSASANEAQFGFPTIRLHSLPALLQGVYAGYKPEITTASRCAATFDASGDADHMVLKCSIYIRMAAEGARRAMQYCEEERIAKHISQPCKLVIE